MEASSPSISNAENLSALHPREIGGLPLTLEFVPDEVAVSLGLTDKEPQLPRLSSSLPLLDACTVEVR